MVFPCTNENIQPVKEACTVLLREEVIIFSWCCNGLSLIQRNLKKCILFTDVFTGNNTFLTENITQDKKRFITQSKHMIF